MRLLRMFLAAGLAAMTAAGCTAGKVKPVVKPIPAVAHVDLPRFMGDWYVIAHIPSFPERHAFDAIETYAMRPDGRIQTTFRYRNKGFDAPVKTMRPVGTVKPGTGNAVWDMQFIWPIQAEYVVVYLSDDYSQTIIGRSARDYVWVMSRTPRISEADYAAHLQRLRDLGYDLAGLRVVPHADGQTAGEKGITPAARP